MLFLGAIACAVRGAPAGAHQGAAAGENARALPVAITASVQSLFGDDLVVLTGWLQIEQAPPHDEGGRSVIELEAVLGDLVGASRLGAVIVTERPNQGQQYASTGELRALQAGAQFPASNYLDLYLDAAAPESPLGPLALHNEDALHLVPLSNGGETSVSEWPAFGVQYGLAMPPGGPDCLPLLNPDNSVPDARFCVRDMVMSLPPLLPSYSVARGGPRGFHPASIFALAPRQAFVGAGQLPFLRISCASLGLTADGCDDGADGDQDDIDALSYGVDLAAPGSAVLNLSVGPGALGAPGTAVAQQVACPPSSPGLAPEPEPDVFASIMNAGNTLVLDGNGPIGACTQAFPLGFTEAATVRDNLDALDTHDPSLVDTGADGVPEGAVYFSLDALSPSLAAFGATPADVLRTSGGAAPTIFASSAQLGLQPGDDIDGVCLREDGNGVYDAADRIYFSLAPGSPSLTTAFSDPGDVLAIPPPRRVLRAADSGLASGDDVDALGCATALEGATGDTNCDVYVNSIDASLVLQYNAGLIDVMPCVQGADVNGSGGVDSVDAALILQYHAGLVTHLPPVKARG